VKPNGPLPRKGRKTPENPARLALRRLGRRPILLGVPETGGRFGRVNGDRHPAAHHKIVERNAAAGDSRESPGGDDPFGSLESPKTTRPGEAKLKAENSKWGGCLL